MRTLRWLALCLAPLCLASDCEDGPVDDDRDLIAVTVHNSSPDSVHVLIRQEVPQNAVPPAGNKLAPGTGRRVDMNLRDGESVRFRVVRAGAELASRDCALGFERFDIGSGIVVWNGAAIDCNGFSVSRAPLW